MLGQRRRRCPNYNPALGQRLMFFEYQIIHVELTNISYTNYDSRLGQQCRRWPDVDPALG